MFPMKTKIFSSLQHPLLLLIVGGIITGLLLPYITTQWQNHQKELELKTDLVSEISDSIASVLTKTQVKKAVASTTYDEFYDAYKNWESSRAIIKSKLSAYYPNSDLPSLWHNYSLILTDFAFLSVGGSTCTGTMYVKEIQKYFDIDGKVMNKSETKKCPKEFDHLQQIHSTPFGADLKDIDWNYLVQSRNETGHLSQSWLTLKENLETQKDRIIQEILNSKIQTFS